MERWNVIRSIVEFPSNRKGRSLGNISQHLQDVTNVDVYALQRALDLELGQVVAQRFGAKLHSAFKDDNHPTRGVDARYIITFYRAFILASLVFHEAQNIYLKLLKDYALEKNDGTTCEDSWLISDILRVVSVAATTDEEVHSTANLLKQSINQLTTDDIISTEILMKALDSCPDVMEDFRSQIIAKLSDDQRLELLSGEEDKALRAFLRQSNRVIGAKRRQFFLKRFLSKAFAAWRKDLMLAMRAKQWKKRMALSTWLVTTKRIRLSRVFVNISDVNFCKSRGRKSLRKLVRHMRNMKKIKRCYTGDVEKNIRAGFGLLRICLKKIRAREALFTWISYTILSRNGMMAQKWHETKVLRRAFHAFNQYSMTEIKSRKIARKASIQQRLLVKQLKDIDSSLMPNTGKKVPDSLLAKQKIAQQFEEARLRQMKNQKELDENILKQQRVHRRERVASNQRQREELFKKKWDRKKIEVENDSLERNKSWTLTSEFKHQREKKQKEIQRHLSINQASNGDREAAITSQAVISYSILDAKLAHEAGVAPDELFLRLGRLPSPINAVPFQSVLLSCGLTLKAEELQSIFDAIARYNLNELSIRLDGLHELRRLSDTYIGQEGSRWKMYVSPIHQTQLLHNVATGKMIYEKHIKKKHIREMVSDNMQDHELMKARRRHFFEREQAHKGMIRYHAANSIQSMYYQWKGRQTMEKQRWILERRNLFRLRIKQAGAAALIQQKFRARNREANS